MRTRILIGIAGALLLPHILGAAPSGPEAAPPAWADRWVWVFGWGLRSDAEVAEITEVLEASGRSGLNGAVLSAGLDTLCKKPPEFFRRLDAVKASCRENGLELIPSVFSVGYGGSVLAHDRHLAEGVPVDDAPFRVRDGAARLETDPEIRIANGGFEEHDGDRLRAFAFHDKPGAISFVDTRVAHGGSASLRFEGGAGVGRASARVMQPVRVRPHRVYRVSLWAKTEGFEPAGRFRILALADRGDREIAPRTFRLPSTSGWRRIAMLVNSLEYDSIRLYAGVWGGLSGKLWLDDWTLEEVGPINVLRRPGTPVTVKSEDGSVVYTEGRDYAPLEDPRLDFHNVDRDAPPLRILEAGRIRDGQRLRVSWFHPMVIHESQITVCMAEPALYRIYEEEAKLLAEHLRPRRILLSMDEIRMGGTCLACRGKDLGALVGQCITRQAEILRRFNPGAEIYVWSDMLDPNHNARGGYYLAEGSFAGSWEHVPKDLVIAVWGGAPRPKSLGFFSQHGFETLIACYYDAGDLDDVKGWIRLAEGTTGVRGFMYTPWQKKYALLPAFGDLLER
ncbi:MAG: hypothetical protein JXP34_27515 [Planctomycetes bacterium]|nr:hypothetical protein [Planctomycetota bacterium]